MSLNPKELQSLLVLNRLLLSGAKAVHHWLWEGHAPSQILGRIQTEDFLQKAEALQKLQSEFSAEREIEKAQKEEVRFLTILDPDYPAFLKHITDPPLVLYLKGNFCETDQAAVAMVGTRHPSLYGLNQARVFARGLAESGVTVVSGLAQGIDQAAHKAALEISYGRTIAVLGCGLDQDYPAGSRKLRDQIIERGAVISEYAFGGPPCAENFPRRNRIIAGLSRGVLVVEAHARSGSLITARLAMEEGREVFAVPGPVDQLTSRGTNHLIKEGACLVECAEDIIQELGPQLLAGTSSSPFPYSHPRESGDPIQNLPERRTDTVDSRLRGNDTEPLNANGLTDADENSLLGVLTDNSLSPEEITAHCTFEPQRVSSLLTRLELQRKIQRTHDGRFCAVR